MKTFFIYVIALSSLLDAMASHFPCGGDVANPVEWCIKKRQSCEQGGDGNYFCQCLAGYKGDNCDPYDECKAQYPCVGIDGVTSFCIDYFPPEKFKCQCLHPYVGVLPAENDVVDPVPPDWRPLACVMENNPEENDAITQYPSQEPTEEPTPYPSFSYSCNDNRDCTGRNKRCLNGSCVCQDGYFSTNGLLSAHCKDEEECANDLDNCHRFATCTNTDGSFYCTCNEGYKDADSSADSGIKCVNINECEEGVDTCSDEQLCIDRNPPTFFECVDPTDPPTQKPTASPIDVILPPLEIIDTVIFGKTYVISNTTQLDFSHNELTGTIPFELGLLTKMTFLDFWSNQLTGTIPSELGLLTKMTYLNFWSNQLTGTIPSELGLLTNLSLLGLHENQLTGTIPSELGLLTNLWGLSLVGNQLKGTIPSVLGLLPNMISLELDDNDFTGNVTSIFCDPQGIDSIHVDCGNVTCSCCVGPGCAS